MNKRVWILVVLAVGLMGGGGLYYRSLDAAHGPTPVTAPVTRGDVIAKVDATGTLQPVTTVQVGTQVSGTIKALYADFNAQVHRGQVVAELEPSLFQTQVDQARATVTRLEADADRAKVGVDDAQMKLRRAQELFSQKLIAAMDLETAQANAMQADAALKSAQAQIAQARAALNQNEVTLSHTIIRAPIDGIVISRNVDVGQTVAASMQAPTLFVLAQDLTRMQVRASIDESDIGRVVTGQEVSFRVDAYPNETFTGAVSQVRLEPKTEQNVVSYTTIIDVPNPDLKLKPGMTANVTVRIASNENVLRIPNTALRFRPTTELFAALGQPEPEPVATSGAPVTSTRAAGTTGARRSANAGNGGFARVWVLRNGTLQAVRVRTGVTDGALTAIVEGELTQGDQVVTAVADLAQASAQTTTASPLLPVGRGGGGGAAGNRAGGAAAGNRAGGGR